MPTPIITFTSDFGMRDWFVGVVHGVILERCPDARIADLSHAIDPGDVASAAFVLEAAAPDFPAGTVHLAVVDPGVGTARRALVVAAHGHVFVGPDNGVLEWALMDPRAVAYALEESKFFRHPVSRTFHGRDVFAPVAAHVALGVPLDKLGPRVSDPVRLARPRFQHRDGGILGRVAYIDHFGNALTTITTESLEEAFPRAHIRRLPGHDPQLNDDLSAVARDITQQFDFAAVSPRSRWPAASAMRFVVTASAP